MSENGANETKAALPLAILRDLKIKPKQGDKPACIDLQIRLPVDEETAAALPFLMAMYRDAPPAAFTVRLSHKSAAAVAAVRRSSS